jgi:hypothetical protein
MRVEQAVGVNDQRQLKKDFKHLQTMCSGQQTGIKIIDVSSLFSQCVYLYFNRVINSAVDNALITHGIWNLEIALALYVARRALYSRTDRVRSKKAGMRI